MSISIYFPILLSICLGLLVNVQLCFGVSCKDEDDNDVDWFILYKLPKDDEDDEGDDMEKGTSYAYVTSEDQDEFQISDKGIDDDESMLARTWKQLESIQEKKEDTAYLLYNDDEPEGADDGTTGIGHLKGLVAFDEDTGIWITHSIPKCCEAGEYEYPKNALTNAQHVMCITFEDSCLQELCHHLLYCSPNVYDYHLSDEKKSDLEDDTQTLFSDDPDHIDEKPYERITNLTSKGGQEFTLFAKSNKLEEDIYSYWMMPELDTDLIVNTWISGQGGKLDPECSGDHTVVDVEELEIGDATFKTTDDHSKWAISSDSSKPWVCMADLNRMESQEKRGGGAVCFESEDVRDVFEEAIKKKKDC